MDSLRKDAPVSVLEGVKVELRALRAMADELAPGEMTEVTAQQIRNIVQMIVVLTDALAAVIEKLEREAP